MVRYFCDRCGKEIDEAEITLFAESACLYVECESKFQMIKDRLEGCMNFLNMSDEDIELMAYNFKVGDEVITSDGRIGIIESICDCDRCKKRGFYEPQVKLSEGVGGIYITDTDKKNGFSNFYKIGKYKFGNVDTEDIRENIVIAADKIAMATEEFNTYRKQLKRMEAMKNTESKEDVL